MNGKARLDWSAQWLKQEKRLYIGGEWVRSQGGSKLGTFNPATGEALSEIFDATQADVDLAAASARQAFKGPWSQMTRAERASRLVRFGQLIRDHAEELATLETLNNGKTFREALGDDLPESASVFDYYAGWIGKLYGESVPVEQGFVNFTRREPIGVCGLIVPWNFPLLLACWKMAPALAMGNTVIVKPSPFTPLSLIRLAEIIHEAGILPPGTLNLVTGGLEAGEAISRHPGIDKISFTGSTSVGKKIVEASGASNLKSVTLELGGKSPNILFDDAKDLDRVIDRSFTAMFSHKGEKCSEPTRFLVQEGIYDRVAEALAKKAEAVVCGDPFDPRTQQGPQCHEAHFRKVMSYIETGRQEGAKLLAGGGRDSSTGNEKGLFIRPTIFGNVRNDMRIAQEEIFGPVLCLIPFKTEDEAVRIANDSPYGLAAGLYSGDTSRAHRVANRLEAGMVFVNHYGCYDFASPFGGIKQSGWGKEMGAHSLEAYTRMRSIWIRYE
jgi:aldehyde dehydrogenase (NAD+)